MGIAKRLAAAAAVLGLAPGTAFAGVEEALAVAKCGGTEIPYVLSTGGSVPKYSVILYPGADGVVGAHLDPDGRLVYKKKGNFLLRARPFFVDGDFAAAAADADNDAGHVACIAGDLRRRFPGTRVYLVGTSRGTFSTVRLAPRLSGVVEGVVHTSSLADSIQILDGKAGVRQLVLHHESDYCRVTPFSAAQRAAKREGVEFIAVEGGRAEGRDCGPLSHHGYLGIEKEVAGRIKDWIRRGP